MSRVPPAAIVPVTVTRHNCEAVTGIPWRVVLEHPEIPRAKIDRLIVVRVSDLLAWLDQHRADLPPPSAEPEDSVDSVLAEVGLRRAVSR